MISLSFFVNSKTADHEQFRLKFIMIRLFNPLFLAVIYMFASLMMSGMARANPDISVSLQGNELTSGVQYSASFFKPPLPEYSLQTDADMIYTITNRGTATLELEDLAPVITAVGPGIDSLGAKYGGSLTVSKYSERSLVPNGTATFTVTLNVFDDNYEYNVLIKSNDQTDPSFSFDYIGEAVAPDRPEIVVSDKIDGLPVLDGRVYELPPGFASNVPEQLGYQIDNYGKKPLQFIGAKPTISGENNVEVTVTNYSETSLAQGESAIFDLTITSQAEGDFSFNVAIESNDQDESALSFTVEGFATSLPIPDVEIEATTQVHDGRSEVGVGIYFTNGITGFTRDDIVLSGAEIIPDGTLIEGIEFSGFQQTDVTSFIITVKPKSLHDITIDIPAGVAEDARYGTKNRAAKQLVIKGPLSISSELSSTKISDFLINRANHILISQTDMIGFITNDNNNSGGPLGDLQLNSDLINQTSMSFYTSRSKILGAIKGDNSSQNDLSLADGKEGATGSANSTGATGSANRTGTFDIWTQIKGSQSSRNKDKHKFWAAQLGGHYFFENDMLAGLMGQFDWSEQQDKNATGSPSSKTSGNGFMVGPYIAGKIKDQALYYEARGLWGQSNNKVNPDGTLEDSFKANRWLISAKFKGFYDLGSVAPDLHGLMLKPLVSLSYFEETHQDYISHSGGTVGKQKISLGEFRFGPGLTRSFDLGEKMGESYHLETNLAISGIANFAVNNANASTEALFDAKSRARIDGGIEIRNSNGVRFTAAGFYDGLGAKDYSAYGGRLGLAMPIY